MVSFTFTTHLHDATMVKCYVNSYRSNQHNLVATFDKLEGKSEFKGTANDLVWVNRWQAR